MPARGQVRDQVGEVLRFQIFLEPLGHERLTRGGHLLDLGTEQHILLPVLAAEGHRGGRLTRDQAVQDAAVGGRDVKLAYFASKARFGSRIAIRSDSGDLSFKAARSGPTSAPFVPDPVTRNAELLEDGRAGGSVALDAQC